MMHNNFLFTFFLFLAFSVSGFTQEIEEPYLIKSIYFGGGSHYIDNKQVKELSDWIDAVPDIDRFDISIHSHTDNIGSIEYNNWLSKMRGESVLLRLIEKNIPREFILIEDFGELNPHYNNNTWQGKLHNRRVDVILRPIVL